VPGRRVEVSKTSALTFVLYLTVLLGLDTGSLGVDIYIHLAPSAQSSADSISIPSETTWTTRLLFVEPSPHSRPATPVPLLLSLHPDIRIQPSTMGLKLPSIPWWWNLEWRNRKRTMLTLCAIEFPPTVAALTLFGIADPNTYRTKMWAEGALHGWNSDPIEILYAYANYKPIPVPTPWTQMYDHHPPPPPLVCGQSIMHDGRDRGEMLTSCRLQGHRLERRHLRPVHVHPPDEDDHVPDARLPPALLRHRARRADRRLGVRDRAAGGVRLQRRDGVVARALVPDPRLRRPRRARQPGLLHAGQGQLRRHRRHVVRSPPSPPANQAY